jgi:UDP-N-acetylmuramoyl-L-alanyl-D-glutamate--2,6-diaminopimelate ligase
VYEYHGYATHNNAGKGRGTGVKASTLTAMIPGAALKGTDVEVSGITDDTRKIIKGAAFIALKGTVTDGHNYIKTAKKNGAGLIVCNSGSDCSRIGLPFIEVPDTRQALKIILPALFPSAGKMTLAGITGTSGKTTTAYLLESIASAAWKNPGLIGTIEIRYGGEIIPANVTTPGSVELFGMLDDMARKNVDICIMEVSSHALDQGRVDGLMFDAGVFMNLSHEHLDYHKNMQEYLNAKKRLFTEYLRGSAVINIDDSAGKSLKIEIQNAITFGNSKNADIRPNSVRTDEGSMIINLETPRGRFELASNLLGRFQVYNIMAATGAAISLGIDTVAIIEGIANLRFVPGRMEPVPNSRGLRILVDYAHKPEALENALEAAKVLSHGKVHTIFGCGGDRDRAKRPLMAAIAEKYSDTVIVTSDNPRTEDPNAIIKEILAGFSPGYNPIVEPDRATAIKLGVGLMEAEDLLIIAGKGHEDYQIIGTKKYPFDDRAMARRAVLEVMS